MKAPKGCPHGWECPRTNDPGQKHYCNRWWEILETNVQTGEQRVKKGCGLSQEMLATALIEVIKASNRPAAAVESCRNEIAQGFQVVAAGMKAIGAHLNGEATPTLTLPPQGGGD